MTPREQATQRIKAVEAALTKARGKWSAPLVALNAWIGATPQSQVLSALMSIELLGVNTWMARGATIEEGDQAAWDKWTKEGGDLLRNISDIAQDAEHGSLDRIIAATVATSAQDARTAVREVWNAKGMLLLGLGLAVALVISAKKAL